MSSVIEAVLIQLNESLIYLPAGCTWAAGIILIILTVYMLFRFFFHQSISFLCPWRLICLFLFIVYTYCILQLTLLSRPKAAYGGIDWRFLVKWSENTAQKAFLLSNIIMFIPLGILLPIMCKWARHILLSLPAAMTCSIAIEALQLKYQLGYCQLDDVIANSAGFLLGFLLYLMLSDLYCFIRHIANCLFPKAS